jgi:hypothetical protein
MELRTNNKDKNFKSYKSLYDKAERVLIYFKNGFDKLGFHRRHSSSI